PLTLEVPVFRLIQEALHNVRKHAQASCVHIRIHMLAGLLLVEVSDNGIGFDVAKVMSGNHGHAGDTPPLGLRSMRKRVQQAGGKWEIESKHGRGTTIWARFSLTVPRVVLTSREREVLRLLIEGLT